MYCNHYQFILLIGRIIVDVKTIDRDTSFPDCGNAETIRFTRPVCGLFISFKHQCIALGKLFENCVSCVVEATCGIFGAGIFRKLLTGKIMVSSNKQ